MIKFFNVDRQYQQDREIYLDLADRVYSSGQVIAGPYSKQLADCLKLRTGRKYCILTASCTDALAFVNTTLVDDKNTLFVFPELSFPATNNAAIREFISYNPHQVYIKTDSQGNIDLDCLDEFLYSAEPSTKINVVWVNLFGHTIDYDHMHSLQLKYPNVNFIEDAAQSFGACWKTIPSGAVGIASCISFDPTKNLNAFGIGGAVLTDCEKLSDRIDLHRRPHTAKWINYGYNSQINEVDAAIVWWKLENRFDQWQQKRTAIAEYYLQNINALCIMPNKNCTSAWHKFVILHDQRDQLKSKLEELSIETKIHYPLTLNGNKNNFTQSCLSLPIYPELSDSEIEYIVQSVNKTIELLF